jgi:DNA-binding NtrC family response regulator
VAHSEVEYGALKDASILIVDDEFLIALNLEMLFFDKGARVSVATTLSSALDIALSDSFCAALLDFRLGHQTSEQVATVLSRRGIPFLFFSGHSIPASLRTRFPHAPTLSKPSGIQQLLGAAEELVRSRAA